MTDKFSFLYVNKPREEIENALFQSIELALHRKYGETPDEKIKERMRQEWKAIEINGAVLDIAALYELTVWLKHQKVAYWLTSGASSFIFYLLEITASNPLPPHYYCPSCYRIHWQAYCKDGFDLECDIVCDHDMTTLIPDGHDLPWQIFLGYEKEFKVELRVEEKVREKLFDFLQNHWLRKFKLGIEVECPYAEYQKLIRFGNITLVTSINYEKIPAAYHERIFDISYVDAALDNWKALIKVPVDYLDNIEQPSYFSELVALCGLMRSTGAWDEEAFYMVEKFGYRYADLICHREDIYQYLLLHGFIEKDAWRGSESVRTGNGLIIITDEMFAARDKWVIDRAERIEYLFPKAHTIEFMSFCLRTGYFEEVERLEESHERWRENGNILERIVPQIQTMSRREVKEFLEVALSSEETKAYLEMYKSNKTK